MSASPLALPPSVSKACKSFENDTGGTIAVLFALALLIITGVLGAAVDLGAAYKQRGQLLLAADSASLVAVSQGSPGLLAAAAMIADGRVPVAEAAAVNAFNAEVHGQDGQLEPHATSIVTKTGTVVTSTINFTVDMHTHFLELFGINTLKINGSATSVNGTPAFVDFYLLLDNSPSMGVAATPADVATMVANTPDQCAFACHEADKPGADYYTLAHNLGVTTRIDVMRQATQKLMDTAEATATVRNQFRMSIDTFNTNIHNISPLTTDLATAKADAATIDLMEVAAQTPNPLANNDRDTDFDAVLPQLNAKVPNSGSGVTSADPQRVAFIVTDGVADAVDSTIATTTSGAWNTVPGEDRLIEALNPSLCDAMKARGVKVAVIYTSVLPLPTNGFYNAYVAPWRNQINPKTKACASPGYFFEVSPTQGIDEAMKALFLKAVAEARITS